MFGKSSAAKAVVKEPANDCVKGDLKNFSIFDITHTLMMGRKTALLTVQNGAKKGYLFFKDGKIISAIDDALASGEQAAFNIFFWRGGVFSIDFDAAVPQANIKTDTESLILDIARNLDEKQRDNVIEEGDSDVSGTVKEQFEDRFRNELNKVFTNFGSDEAPVRDLYSATAFDALLDQLDEQQGSALFIRANRPARIKSAAGFVTPRESPVTAEEIEGYLNSLLTSVEQEHFAQRREVAVFYTNKAGRSFNVQIFFDQGQPACVFNPASKKSRVLKDFAGNIEVIESLLNSDRGLILIVGPLGTGKTATMAAMIDHALRHHDILAHLYSRTQRYEFVDDQGVLLRSDLSRFTLDQEGSLHNAIDQGSDLIAVNPIASPQVLRDAVSVANHASFVVASVEAEDLDDLSRRILEWSPGTQGELTRRRLANAIKALVQIRPQADGSLTLNCTAIDATTREKIAASDFRSIAEPALSV